MVKKIKKRVRRPAGAQQSWHVGFNKANQAGVYIHKHGDSDDHSQCGPVVACCHRASEKYRISAPELHSTVERYETQRGSHLASWIDNGLGALYFVLCDPNDEHAFYQFGLPAERARGLLTGATSHSAFYRPEFRQSVSGEKA